MALGTVTIVKRSVFGNFRVTIADIQVTAGANYTTGGESLPPSKLGLNQIFFADCGPAVSSTPTTFQVAYNTTSSKLVAYGQNATPGPAVAQPQVTANTDLSGFTARCTFIGQ